MKEDAYLAYYSKLDDLQAVEDWSGVADTYLKMGDTCKKDDDLDWAHMWYRRAFIVLVYYQTLSGTDYPALAAWNDDRSLYAMDSMDDLDCYPEVVYAVDSDVFNNFEQMHVSDGFYWALFSLCRMEKLFLKLSKLPDCEGLGKISWVIDELLCLDTDPVSMERLYSFARSLDDWNISPAYLDTRQVLSVPGNPDFEPMDLELDNVLESLSEFLRSIHDSVPRSNVSYKQKLEALELNPAGTGTTIRAAMLTGYWLRTNPAPTKDVPQILSEIQHILEDYEFLQARPSQEAILQRIAMYRNWDLFTGGPAAPEA